MRDNKVVVQMNGMCGVAEPIYQYDRGLILIIKGLSLPETYKVDFATEKTGKGRPMLGSGAGVVIPDDMIEEGRTIYAWIYLHTGPDDGETVAEIIIPVTPRASSDDDTPPTPEQQSIIDQLIIALNAGVELVEKTAEEMPQQIQDALTEAKESGEFDGPPGKPGAPGQPGDDGISPVVTVTDITGGHRITITDAEGIHFFDILDGAKGDPGQPGAPGQPGDDGISPTISVTNIAGGHRVNITDANGTQSFDVMDGDAADAPVQDVQVNGTSILQNGVADVPMATASALGVARMANDALVKAANDFRSFVTPSRIDAAAFYGLTKAAGVDMASSSNPVGTYTDAAKVAIQKMLGIYEAPWELIREGTFTTSTASTYQVTVDGNGQAFELTDVVLMFETPTQAVESSANGNLVLSDGSKNIASLYCGAWTQPANSVAHGCWIVAKSENGLTFAYSKGSSSSTNTSYLGQSYAEDFAFAPTQCVVESENFIVRAVKIAAVLGTGHYKLYGKRKWN